MAYLGNWKVNFFLYGMSQLTDTLHFSIIIDIDCKWRYTLVNGKPIFVTLQAVFNAPTQLLGCYGVLSAAFTLHSRMLTNVMQLPQQFFETNSLGRIMARFSQDMNAIDVTLPMIVQDCLYCIMNVRRATLFMCRVSAHGNYLQAIIVPCLLLSSIHRFLSVP